MSQKGSVQSHVRVQHVIEAPPRPASTLLLQCSFGFELCDGERLSGKVAGVDDPRGAKGWFLREREIPGGLQATTDFSGGCRPDSLVIGLAPGSFFTN
jgi:hypothetical protein